MASKSCKALLVAALLSTIFVSVIIGRTFVVLNGIHVETEYSIVNVVLILFEMFTWVFIMGEVIICALILALHWGAYLTSNKIIAGSVVVGDFIGLYILWGQQIEWIVILTLVFEVIGFIDLVRKRI